jgi:hypothetical protein
MNGWGIQWGDSPLQGGRGDYLKILKIVAGGLIEKTKIFMYLIDLTPFTF